MILVVDDEKIVRDVVRRLIERAGYEFREAGSGEEALKVLHDSTPAPQLMLTDIVMPGMSGLALAAQVHKLRPALPVIFMSGFASQYRDELSGTVCLTKPFKPVDLLMAIESVIGPPRKSQS